MTIHDLMANPQPEARALVALRGEEWLEDFRHRVGRHPRTAICNSQYEACAPSCPIDSRSAAYQQTATGDIHTVDGIPNKIAQDLADLPLEAGDCRTRSMASFNF